MSTAAVVYYSDNHADATLLAAVRRHLRRVAGDLPIIAVTLQPTEDWGARPVVLRQQRGARTMAQQIYAGLLIAQADVVFLAEHDCLYPDGYFDHRPSSDQVYSYAGHTWKVDTATGRTLHYRCEQVSGLSADRRLLVDHYARRVAHIEQHGFSMRLGYEPGKPIRHGGLDDVPRDTWWNDIPIVDIRHNRNLSPSRWRKDQFRNQQYTEGWTEGTGIPGWGETAGRFWDFLADVTAPVGMGTR